MTETDIRYQRGQIYCIRSPHTEMVYYGSTISPLCKRFHNHNKDMEYGRYCSSQEILALGDAHIELVENYPCNSRKELDRREGQIQRENKNICVNLLIAGRTPKEFYKAHKTLVLARNKEYFEANKDAISEQRKERYKANRDTILASQRIYKKANRDAISEQKKQYYQTHKDTILASQRIYKKANRDPINAKRNEHRRAKKTSTASPDPLASCPSSQPN